MKKQHYHTIQQSLRGAMLTILTFAFGSLLWAQPGKTASSDTTEVVVGNKVITITIDSLTGKKDVQIRTLDKSPSVAADGEEQPWGEGNEYLPKENREIKHVDVEAFNLDLGANWLFHNDYDSLSGYPTGIFENIPLRSTHVGIHVLKTRINLAKGHVGLVTAITFDNNRYQFRKNITLQPDQPQMTAFQDSLNFKKNKLISWYAQIPLLLSFQTNPQNQAKNFHIAIGGYAGLLLGASTKQKSDEKGKVVKNDDFNLATFRYGLTARIGYGPVELYSNYSLTPLFQENQGPSFGTINFGVSLTGLM